MLLKRMPSSASGSRSAGPASRNGPSAPSGAASSSAWRRAVRAASCSPRRQRAAGLQRLQHGRAPVPAGGAGAIQQRRGELQGGVRSIQGDQGPHARDPFQLGGQPGPAGLKRLLGPAPQLLQAPGAGPRGWHVGRTAPRGWPPSRPAGRPAPAPRPAGPGPPPGGRGRPAGGSGPARCAPAAPGPRSALRWKRPPTRRPPPASPRCAARRLRLAPGKGSWPPAGVVPAGPGAGAAPPPRSWPLRPEAPG